MTRIAKTPVPGRAPAPELVATRAKMAGMIAAYPRHAGVEISYRQYAAVRCLVITPPAIKGRVLYFHGGGFRLGSPEVVAGFISHLAAEAGCEMVIPFYSLAPEQPFPAALLEGEAVLEALLAEQPTASAKLLIGGDSAGGGLAAVLARHYADVVHGLWLLSPWLDLRGQAASYDSNAAFDPMFSRQSAQAAAELYLQRGEDPSDPDISPLLGDFSTLPATQILVGSREVLLDDSLGFANRLAAQHRAVALHVLPDMLHVEPTLRYDSPYTSEVLALSSRFLAARCLSEQGKR